MASTDVAVALKGIFPESDPLAGITAEFTGPKIAAALALPAEQPAGNPPSGDDDWPEPEPLGDSLPDVMEFDLELMPDSLRPLVRDIAYRMQVRPDFPAATIVVVLAGLVGRRAVIQPKERDSGWIVVPNLWGGIVAPPGMMKSPVLSLVTGPAQAIESRWRVEGELAQSEFAALKELHEVKIMAWKQNAQRDAKKGNPAPAKPEDNIPEPTLRRLIVNDSTPEALHDLLSKNPAGLLVCRDELTGWLEGLEREGRQQERAFFLECWNGDSSFSIDRIKRGTIHVPHACVSLFGGIQPARLRSYLADALKDGPSNDGLMQRFQLLVYPDAPKDWKYVDSTPNEAATQAAREVYETLAGMDVKTPLQLNFDAQAQALFVEWLTDLERRIRGDDLSPAMTAHLAKYRSLMPSLALLFTLADGRTDCVPLEHAQRAAAWCEYLETHARRVYASACPPEEDAARTLARHLATGWKAKDGFFTIRDVYRPNWSSLKNAEEVGKAVGVLTEWGWVRPAARSDVKGSGRPTVKYLRNPRIEARHAT